MNNRYFILVLAITAFLIIGCKERCSKAVDMAYVLSATAPDSALEMLNGVKQTSLGKSEKARYALVYTIAQDKSGLDVDNDSLLRTAYTYYNNRPDDSFYAKCMYYMGKYYMLNDSSELALNCLQKSAKSAEQHEDKHTQCLALEKLSQVIRVTNTHKALEVAREAERIYSTIPNSKTNNVVYLKLNVAEALLLADSVKQSERVCLEAIRIALASRDSQTVSDAYQDLSTILSEKGDLKNALLYSRKSYELGKKTDVSKLLNLAWAYFDIDSLAQVNKLLDKVKTSSPSNLYMAYYLRLISSIKGKDYDKAMQYADSLNHYSDDMYSGELSAKEKYYSSLVKSQYDKGVSEGKSTLLAWIIVLVALSAALAMAFILHSYRQYKLKAKYRMQGEIRKWEAERKIHEEEMKHKEIQLSTMRNFILKRIDTAQKIQELRGNKSDNVLLTEEDWEEIRLFVDGVEGDFITRLQSKFPNLNMEDIRLLMLVRLKMPTKALALIYKISEKSIKQKLFVFKAKVGISGEKTSLRSFIETF